MGKKSKKPTGTSGPTRITAGIGPEFLPLRYPDTKAEIEQLMMSGALTSAKARGIEVYSLTGEPSQNDENNFDFDLPTVRGTEYLDLTEIALLKNRGGYSTGATVFPVGDFADAVFELTTSPTGWFSAVRFSNEVEMTTVQIEHPVRDFDAWKAAFDRDPARREASGVRRYRIFRPVDDPRFVSVDLDFDTKDAAETFVTTMRTIWQRVEGTVMTNPRVRIVDCVERHEY